MNNMKNKKTISIASVTQYVIGILVFGSIWGLLEATLGGAMHLVNFPNTGAIMGGVGMAVMGLSLALYRKPLMLMGIGAIAASFKLLNVWLLLIPINVPHIINPVAAILLEAIAFSLVTSLFMNWMTKNPYAFVWGAVLAGILSAFSFALVAVYLTHIPINTQSGIDSVREFVISNGLVQAIFAGVLAPSGYLAGKKLTLITSYVSARKSVFYAISTTAILTCLGISTLAIIAGL